MAGGCDGLGGNGLAAVVTGNGDRTGGGASGIYGLGGGVHVAGRRNAQVSEFQSQRIVSKHLAVVCASRVGTAEIIHHSGLCTGCRLALMIDHITLNRVHHSALIVSTEING